MPEFVDLESNSHQDDARPSLSRCSRPSKDRRRQPVHIIDNDNDDGDSSDTLAGDPVIMTPPTRTRTSANPGDYMADEEFDRYLTELSSNAARSRPRRASYVPSKTIIPSHSQAGRTYKKGKSVELHDESFLRVQEVVRDEQGEIFLRGWRFERYEDMDSLVPRRINELCWIINLVPGQTEAAAEYDEIALNEVKGMRIIRLTSHQYPTMSAAAEARRQPLCRQEGQLYCRTKYIRVWVKKSAREQRVDEAAIVFLRQEEADHGFQASDEELRYGWRGVTRLGGSFVGRENLNGPMFIDLCENAQPGASIPSRRRKYQRYTFGDGFCGAGGVSRGALQAGLHVSWGFDICAKAMDTYRLNFLTAVGETCEVAHFLTNDPADIKVDILHFSPPCQTFSSAKTMAAATDDDNEACIFSTRELLVRVKPRVATMEETSGLIQRHREFLYATIHNFVDLGYSVRWKLLDCQDYGVPQQRKRLVVMGSGPGEALPSFPPRTHGPPESGLLPHRTILDAIGHLTSDADNHDPERFILHEPRHPYDPHRFAKTVTCNGGENYHPSGTRMFTHREAACLQTFPLEHRFCGVGVMKQIGNAVPPMLAKALFRHVVKQLERADGRRGR